MARDRQGGQAPAVEIDLPMPGGLGRVQGEGDAIFPADPAHRRCVLDAAAHVGAVGDQDQTGVGTDYPAQVFRVHPSPAVAGDAVEGYPLLRQGLEGAHDGVVLHGADQAVVPGAQPAPQDHIQPHGVAGGQHAVGGIAVAEQAAQLLPQQQGGHPRLLGGGVDAPVHGGAVLLYMAQHGVRHGGGLGKGGGGVVQVDGRHSCRSYRFFWLYHTTACVI